MERTLNLLRPQQGQTHVPQPCPVLAGCLPCLGEHRGAGDNAATRNGTRELYWEEALSDNTHVVGASCQLLANVAALGEADAVHEGQVGLQGQRYSWGQVMDTLGNTCRGGERLGEV